MGLLKNPIEVEDEELLWEIPNSKLGNLTPHKLRNVPGANNDSSVQLQSVDSTDQMAAEHLASISSTSKSPPNNRFNNQRSPKA